MRNATNLRLPRHILRLLKFLGFSNFISHTKGEPAVGKLFRYLHPFERRTASCFSIMHCFIAYQHIVCGDIIRPA